MLDAGSQMPDSQPARALSHALWAMSSPTHPRGRSKEQGTVPTLTVRALCLRLRLRLLCHPEARSAEGSGRGGHVDAALFPHTDSSLASLAQNDKWRCGRSQFARHFFLRRSLSSARGALVFHSNSRSELLAMRPSEMQRPRNGPKACARRVRTRGVPHRLENTSGESHLHPVLETCVSA